MLLTWIAGSLKRYEADHQESGGETPLRRINRRAYSNVIQTLLDTPAQGLNNFPDDGKVDGYDTVGSGLYTTGYLYDLYMQCAERTLNAAIATKPMPPKVIESKFPFHRKDLESNAVARLEKQAQVLSEDPRKFRPIDLPEYLVPIRKIAADHYGVKMIDHIAEGSQTFNALEAQGIDWRNDHKIIDELIASIRTKAEDARARNAQSSDFQSVGTALEQKIHFTVTDPGVYVVSVRQLFISNSACPLPIRRAMEYSDSNEHVARQFMVYDPISAPGSYEFSAYLQKGHCNISVGSALSEKARTIGRRVISITFQPCTAPII